MIAHSTIFYVEIFNPSKPNDFPSIHVRLYNKLVKGPILSP